MKNRWHKRIQLDQPAPIQEQLIQAVLAPDQPESAVGSWRMRAHPEEEALVRELVACLEVSCPKSCCSH